MEYDEEYYLDLVEKWIPSANLSDKTCLCIVFEKACELNSIKIVSRILESNVMSVADIDKMFHIACKNGHLEIVEKFLEKTDPSEHLKSAVMGGNINIVRLFLKYPSVDPCQSHFLAVRTAIQFNRVEILKLFLNCPGVNPFAAARDALCLMPELPKQIQDLLEYLDKYKTLKEMRHKIKYDLRIDEYVKELKILKIISSKCSMIVLDVVIENVKLDIKKLENLRDSATIS